MKHYSVSELSRVMGRNRKSILSLIRDGLLVAYDANPTGERRLLRVTEVELQAFMQRQAVGKKDTRRRKLAASKKRVKEFF